MASIAETTAVSLRKGLHEDNLNFTGVNGELVYDSGINGTGTDIETTIRIHNGVTKGGIPMARADMRNVTTAQLAENREYMDDKNLAYADLSNVEEMTNEQQTKKDNLINILVNYGLVKDATVLEYLEDYALKNMSNVDTVNLATNTGHAGKNLAYADTTNINTADLVSDVIHTGENGNKPLAYADGSNLDTTQLTTTPANGPALAEKDLSNVPAEVWNDILINDYNFETKNNKDSNVTAFDNIIPGHYPETGIVKNYVDNVIREGAFLKRDFTNATTFEALYSNSGEQIYEYETDPSYVTDGGSGFVVGTNYYTGEVLTEENRLLVIVDSVNTNGVPTAVSLNITEGNRAYSGTGLYIVSDTNKRCYLNLTCTTNPTTNISTYTIAIDTSATNEGGFIEDDYYEIFDSASTDYSVNRLLYITPTEVDPNDGALINYVYIPNTSITDINETSLTINNPSGTAATIEFNEVKTLPDIGGAGLLKTDLSNLRGMNEGDIEAALNKPWRINHDEEVPDADDNIQDTDQVYYDLATVGMVWKAINGNDNDLVHKAGTETIIGTKTFTDYITALGLRAPSADLAELYEADADYPVGTLIKFGGKKEITIADMNEVNGVISEKPALLLNKDCKGLPIALTGKTKIRVSGKVNKFDKLTNFSNGVAIKRLSNEHKVIAIALEDKDYEDEGLIMCVTKLSL